MGRVKFGEPTKPCLVSVKLTENDFLDLLKVSRKRNYPTASTFIRDLIKESIRKERKSA